MEAQRKDRRKTEYCLFAGYFPIQNPVYSFAIVYEGDPGEKVSGGKVAAPIVPRIFRYLFNKKRLNDVLKKSRTLRGDYTGPSYSSSSSYIDQYEVRAGMVSEPESIYRDSNGAISNDQTVAEPVARPATPSPPANTQRKNNLFNRIFRGRGRR